MPKKKASTVIENGNDKGQAKLEPTYRETHKGNETTSDSKTEKDIETMASELSARIIRKLYTHYGPKDSHTNKHLYQEVMFEVARLSGKPINEVMNNWPKFDIFSISEGVKKVVKEELENDRTIIYRMIMNDKIIADRILAKLIYKTMMQ